MSQFDFEGYRIETKTRCAIDRIAKTPGKVRPRTEEIPTGPGESLGGFLLLTAYLAVHLAADPGLPSP